MESQSHINSTDKNKNNKIDENKNGNLIRLTPIPINEKNQLIYTKERINQMQIGEYQYLFLKEKNMPVSITTELLTEKLSARKDKQNNLFALIDLSQDDIGSRANFGRGHSSSLSPFKCFLEKISNHPLNKLNFDYINSLFLIGSLDLSDLQSKCKDKNPSIPEERKTLIQAVEEIDRRTRQVCDAILKTDSRVILMNGDNNNTISLIASLERSSKKKVVVIYLDIHSDCRDPADGPHSGTWVTQGYDNNLIEQTYLVGFSELHNNQTCVENLLKNKVDFQDYTCQKIQSGQTSIKDIVEDIIKKVQVNHKDNSVVLCIDGDTVSGLPASAGNTMVGFPAFDVYPMIYRLASQLNVRAYHIAELKPSLDATKESAVGEFLVQATYLFLKGSIDSKNTETKF